MLKKLFTKKQTYLLLFLITLLAFIFRIWQVTSVPPSLYWDEVSQGYNSYLIATTGKDEHQEFLPSARFIAFGDYKAPVYIYLDVPFVALLGKTELAVRLPSIIFGTLTVLLVYFLVQNLLRTYEKRVFIGLVAAFFLAISPWHIQLSRAAYEGNIATFFTVLAVTLFLYALYKKSWILIVSGICFVLAFYSFNAHRVFIPLLVMLLAGVHFKELLKQKNQVLTAGIVGILLLIPFFLFFKTPESRLRFQEVNIFTDIETVKKSNELVKHDENTPFAKSIHNRRVLYAKEYLSNYFDFFHPTYLFFTGDVNPRFSHRENGQLFLWMLPLLLLGVYGLLTRPEKSTFILTGWFLLAPLAAATARETPHALRSETFIPTFEMIAAIGLAALYVYINKHWKKFSLLPVILFAGVVCFSVMQFWHNYLTHNPVTNSYDWQYGYKEVVEKVEKISHNYDKVYVTNAYGRAYIYFAWYGNYSPEKFWNEVEMKRDSYGLYNVPRLGRYQFSDSYPSDESGKILYVTLPTTVPLDAKKIDEVKFMNGDPAFILSEKL